MRQGHTSCRRDAPTTWGWDRVSSCETISQHHFSDYERPISLFFFANHTVVCRRGTAYSAAPVGRNHSIYGVTTWRRWTSRFKRAFGPSRARNGAFYSVAFFTAFDSILYVPAVLSALFNKHVLSRNGEKSNKSWLQCLHCCKLR